MSEWFDGSGCGCESECVSEYVCDCVGSSVGECVLYRRVGDGENSDEGDGDDYGDGVGGNEVTVALTLMPYLV